jgi:hypothetical protein
MVGTDEIGAVAGMPGAANAWAQRTGSGAARVVDRTWQVPTRIVAVLLAALCGVTFGAVPALAQTVSTSLIGVPNPVAPGGRLGYQLRVTNNATETKDITTTISYDSNVDFLGYFVDPSSTPACSQAACTGNLSVPCASDVQCSSLRCSGLPTLFCSSDPDCSIFGSCTLPPVGGTCLPTGPPGCVAETSAGAGTSFVFVGVASGASKALNLEVSVDAGAPITDPATFMPQLATSVTATELPGGTALATAETSVSTEGGSAPFTVTMSDTPDPIDPGTALAYRVNVFNFGAVTRDATLALTYDPELIFVASDSNDPGCTAGYCTGNAGVGCITDAQCSSLRCNGLPSLACGSDLDCLLFGPCNLPAAGGSCVPTGPAGCIADTSGTGTDFWLLDLKPGTARQLRLELDLDAGAIVTEIRSSIVVTDSVDSGTVGADEKTTVAICDGALEGDSCDNGDICPGDTCNCHGGACDDTAECEPVPCPGVCALPEAEAGDPCLSFDRCAVSECDASGACVGKQSSGAKICTAGEPMLIDAPCSTDAECDSMAGGDGVCDYALQQVTCKPCESCDSVEGCEVDPAKTGSVCRAAYGDCDVPETCDGTVGTCPQDASAPDGTLCNDGDPATVATTCTGGLCGGGMPSLCGNGSIDDVCSAGHSLLIGAPCSVAGDCDSAPASGDGVCAPEQCDDGNTDSGDCCSPECTYDPLGASCEDGLVCNGEETCNGSGVCNSGRPLDCSQGSGLCAVSNTCVEPGGCVYTPTPASGCLSGWERAAVLITEVVEGREKFKLRMKKGAEIVQGDFGDPTASTDYTVCFYRLDDGGYAGEIIVDRGGATCAGRSCWKRADSRGFTYNDRERSADGVKKAKFLGGHAGKSSMRMFGGNSAAKGLLSQPLGITKGLEHAFTGARIQIRSNDGPACFQADFGVVKRTGPAYFRATN